MIDKALIRFGIGVALLLMVCELTYINALSLLYIVHKQGEIHEYFAIIGSLAFSIVTVIVMRTSESKWPKRIFPIFDALLVFCGFNIEHYDDIINGTDNEIRFYLTIVLSVFTGLITYCLGIINYEKFAKSHSQEHESKIMEYARKVDETETKFYTLKSEFDKKESKIKSLESDLSKKETDIKELNSHVETLKSNYKLLSAESEKYKVSYLLSERSRILKKSEKNRTPDELELLVESENTYNENTIRKHI